MDFRFIFVGKTKDDYVKKGIEKYKSFLKKYGKVEIVESKDDDKKILVNLRENSYKIILDIKGKSFNSEELAEKIENLKNSGYKKFDFLTGGAFGLSEEILKKADLLWKLSDLTFNHQLVRLILLEQIYRAMSIINNEKYHH